MKLFRGALLESAALATLLAIGVAGPAKADYAFSGSGSSGYLNPTTSTEIWHIPAYSGSEGWGSPGISYGTTAYTQSQAAYGMDITFTGGGEITPGSVSIGNAAGCAGTSTGGTTFCTISATDIWEAFQTGPDTIQFLAQNPSYYLSTGQDYFVNVLFSGGSPTGFTGKWLTSFSPTPTPEPASLLVFASALVGLGVVTCRRKRV